MNISEHADDPKIGENTPLSSSNHEDVADQSHAVAAGGSTHVQLEQHDPGLGHVEQPTDHDHGRQQGSPPAPTRQRSLASLSRPYTDNQTGLRGRFRKTMEFPMGSMILMNLEALAHVRQRLPALQSLHWPHIRFLKHHPQWALHRHQDRATSHPPEKSGWAVMSPANHVLVLSCCLAWCGYYICRSHVSVLLPIISQATGLSLSRFSMVFSAGLITTAIGKVANGMLADRYGGQIMFALYLLLAASTTVLMALSPTVAGVGQWPVLGFWVLIWCLNRWFHSGAWGSMILLLSMQLPHRAYGRSLSIVSLGYSGGDMLARLAYGLMLSGGMSWNQAFLIGALVSSLCAIPSLLIWLHRTKEATGTTSPLRSEPTRKTSKRPVDMLQTKEIVQTLLRSRPFVDMTVSYSVMAVLREIMFTWTTVFLVEVVGVTSAAASTVSLFLPVCMVTSANITGYVADHVECVNRVRLLQTIPAAMVTSSCVALAAIMTVLRGSAPRWLVIVLLIVTCFFAELHNNFIEGFQFVALSASINRPATVSGLIAFCSNCASTASSLSVGAILGVSRDVRDAWIVIYYLMSLCATIGAAASFTSLRYASAPVVDAKLVHRKESSTTESVANTAAANQS